MSAQSERAGVWKGTPSRDELVAVPTPSAAQALRLAVRGVAKEVVRFGVERSPYRQRFFWRVPQRGPVVALTLDDGPDPERTPELLRILGHYGARATFFVLGHRAERHPEVVRRVVEAGHGLGNHTWSHPHCPRLTCAEVLEQLERTRVFLSNACGREVGRLVRPPFGEITLAQARALLGAGWRVALWSADGRDYRGATREQVEECGGRLRPRDVMLMHDTRDVAVAALPAVLERLAQRGLRPVTLAGEMA